MPDKINILVVDDSPDKLMSLVAVLEELGENVVAAHSGRDALRRLLDQEFAVILLDVNMPDIDGFETAALIRSRKKTEHVPIIFITAYGDDTHASQGYSLGAVDYILAPIIPEVLRAKVSVFVDLFRKTEQVLRQAEHRVALVREQAARAAAEDATRRFSMLAEASSVLARSLDLDATLDGVIWLFLQRFADQVAVTLADEQRRISATQWGWRTGDAPALQILQPQELDEAYSAGVETLLAAEADLFTVVGSSSPLNTHCIRASKIARNDSAQLASGVMIPLLARGRILGVLALFKQVDWQALPTAEAALVHDLADRAAIALDNARLYRRIQEGDRRKDEFVAMLAHELRNPLGAISNALECLRLGDDDPELAVTARDVLTRQVDQMTHLVDDLLDVSRITRGKVELKKQWIDLATIVSRALATTHHVVTARGHSVAVSLPERPVYLLVDPTRFEQVLANLLHNAAKFTNPGGHIALAAHVHSGELVLNVRDNGIGIPAHVLSRVFDLFAQGEHPLDRSQGGLGIGLTLVRSLVELHGGRIEAFSCGENEGSEFRIRLPLGAPPAELPSPEQDNALEGPPARRILVVDDNADVAMTLVALLRHLGHDVQVRHDGYAAVEASLADAYDIAFVDIGLPGMSGYEVAQRLRGEFATERMFLVAVTGYGQAEDRRRSQEAGFNRHLVKPVRLSDIQQVLADLAATCPADAAARA